MKNKLFVVLLSDSYIRDAQFLNPDMFPVGFDFDNDDAVWDYAYMNDCWSDCAGSIFLDVIRASSEEEAIDLIAQETGYNKYVLVAIQIGE